MAPVAQLTFIPRMLLFSVGKGAMNAPRYWELLVDSAVETSVNTLSPRRTESSRRYIGIHVPDCQHLYEVAGNF
jgi:hypothetical protein